MGYEVCVFFFKEGTDFFQITSFFLVCTYSYYLQCSHLFIAEVAKWLLLLHIVANVEHLAAFVTVTATGAAAAGAAAMAITMFLSNSSRIFWCGVGLAGILVLRISQKSTG